MAEIKEKAKPFFYRAKTKSDSLALLIHGFSGSTYDLQDIGHYLASQGINVQGIRLAGHGSSPEDLAKTSSGDWWQSVEQEFQNVRDKYKKVFMVGYSFGSNLSIDFAIRYPDIIKAIVLLGPSVYIRKDGFARFYLPIKKLYATYQRKHFTAKKNAQEYEERGGYTKIPLKSLEDFFYFIDNYTKKEVSRLDVPTLIIQSTRDKVVHPRSSQFIYDQIRNSKKELFLLDNHEHNPFFCDQKQEIFEKVLKFLKSH